MSDVTTPNVEEFMIIPIKAHHHWIRCTQKNGGNEHHPILIRVDHIISFWPLTKVDGVFVGTGIVLAGDSAPIKVTESIGQVARAIGLPASPMVKTNEEASKE